MRLIKAYLLINCILSERLNYDFIINGAFDKIRNQLKLNSQLK